MGRRRSTTTPVPSPTAIAAPTVGITVVCPGWVRTRIHESSRNRPVTGDHAVEEADVAGENDAMIRDVIGGLIAGGLTPEVVADRVYDAVVAKRFYVLTHAEWASMVRRNTERMLAGENPEMTIPS